MGKYFQERWKSHVHFWNNQENREWGNGDLQSMDVMEVDLEQVHSFIHAAPTTTSSRVEMPLTESCIVSTSSYHPLFKGKETRNPGSQSNLAHI